MTGGRPSGDSVAGGMGARRWVLGVTAVLGTACAGASAPAEPVDPTTAPAPAFDSVPLTTDGVERYAIVADGPRASVTLAGPAGDRNTRLLFWPAGAPEATDQESCATWASLTTAVDQPGAALRVRPEAGGVRALTVTRNVFGGVGFVINVHAWEPGVAGVPPALGSFDLAAALAPGGRTLDLPWRLCARVAGDRLDLVVWPLPGPRPPFGDPVHGGGVDLPSGFTGPGHAGWFVGHLAPGDRLVLDDLTAP
jgi:hypothetical protein